MPVTPANLADALHALLWCGEFGTEIRTHYQRLLDTWDAQEKRGERLADIIRDDIDYAILTFAGMDAIDQHRNARAYLKLYSATSVALGDSDTEQSTHPTCSYDA